MTAFTDTPVWDRQSAVLSWRHYLGDRDDVPYYAAPARADDLSGLPPAYIATSQFDPLRDEGSCTGCASFKPASPRRSTTSRGAYHGSEVVGTAEISRRRVADIDWALRHGLNGWSGATRHRAPAPETGERLA